MIRVPNPVRTISQLIEPQLPAFVQEDYPKFAAFLKAYYEWLEINGPEIYQAKIVSSTQSTVVLPANASRQVNEYQDKSIVVLNGPSKGHTRKIKSYDPVTRIVVVESLWNVDDIPPANTLVSIRDAIYPGKLLEYRDIDRTLDNFIDYFKSEFLYQIPGTILADKRTVLKHIKEFYQARGTENSFRFLFRIMFDEELEFYYPKVDVFRTSDARWTVEKMMRITTTGNTFDWNTRQIVGVASGATASVESVSTSYIAGQIVTDLKLSSIDGEFGIDPRTSLPEQVKIVYPFIPPAQTRLGDLTDLLEPGQIIKDESTYLLLQALRVQFPGENYEVGELIDITGGGALVPAKAIITAVFEKYYNGRVQPPPTTYYLEPYWGDNDVIDNDANPLNDAVVIPGLYYFNDVRSETSDADLLTDYEVLLAVGESDIDNFFVGDEMSFVNGTGVGQKRIITSYNGTTKLATVDVPFSPTPDGSTEYSILHTRGGIKAVGITDFGLGFTSTPTVVINSFAGTGGVVPAEIGIIGTSPGQWTVGRDGGSGGSPTTTDSFASSNKILQDSFYWQDFSYDLRFGQTIDTYRDVVKSLLHPAGLKLFGSVWVKSKPDTSRFLNIIKHYTLELQNKFFDHKIAASTKLEMEVSNKTALVIGRQNKDLDGFKFIDYAPNTQFGLRYPFPNQNYWSETGPGNTQIFHFRDMVIGTFISNPNRRTKIAPDSYLKIDNARSFTRVGPVGQTRRALERGKFLSFPPYQGYALTYPAPNGDYFGDPFGPGNTQIEAFKNVPISDVIVSPETKRSNATVDSDIVMFQDSDGIPSIGNVVEYSFLEGPLPNIVYNVGPNSHIGAYNALKSGGTFMSKGLSINVGGPTNEFVNASAVPLNLRSCSVVIIAKCDDTVTSRTLLQSFDNNAVNGFSFDIINGELKVRLNYDGMQTIVSGGVNIVDDDYFMATMTFDGGKLSVKVGDYRKEERYFPSFPLAPTTTSDGWFFGSPSPDHVILPRESSLYKQRLYGTASYRGAAIATSTEAMASFTGELVYAFFYDRPLYDFEVQAMRQSLITRLLTERTITLT